MFGKCKNWGWSAEKSSFFSFLHLINLIWSLILNYSLHSHDLNPGESQFGMTGKRSNNVEEEFCNNRQIYLKEKYLIKPIKKLKMRYKIKKLIVIFLYNKYFYNFIEQIFL